MLLYIMKKGMRSYRKLFKLFFKVYKRFVYTNNIYIKGQVKTCLFLCNKRGKRKMAMTKGYKQFRMLEI